MFAATTKKYLELWEHLVRLLPLLKAFAGLSYV
jgi:hypothetical protein